MATISPLVHPLRYRLDLTPPNDLNVNATSKWKGRVLIEFRIDGTLNKLSINARNITAMRYKLFFIEDNNARAKRRRRRYADDGNGDQKLVASTGNVSTTIIFRYFTSSYVFTKRRLRRRRKNRLCDLDHNLHATNCGRNSRGNGLTYVFKTKKQICGSETTRLMISSHLCQQQTGVASCVIGPRSRD